MPTIDTTRIDELLAAGAEAGDFPGMVAVAADRDGVIYEGAAGRLRVDEETPAATDTVFWIASMTKAITSVAILQLVEQGRLELDQAVASVLPEFGEPQVLEGFDGDRPRLRAPASQPTIRQLLTHTSGFAYWFFNADITRYEELTGTPNALSFQRAFLQAPLVDDPGARWEYGINIDWLGQIVEAVSGQGLDVYFAEHILGPLGMDETRFVPTDEQRTRLMAIHARLPDGGLARTDIDFPEAPELWCGGHGLHATAGDYLRFQRALLADGELDGARILAPETVELAFSNQIGDIEPPSEIASAQPELSNDISYFPGVRQRWGLGFHLVLDDLPGMRRAGTGDWAGLANSYYWIDRSSGIAGAVFTQVLPFFDARVVDRAARFEQEVYAAVEAPVAA